MVFALIILLKNGLYVVFLLQKYMEKGRKLVKVQVEFIVGMIFFGIEETDRLLKVRDIKENIWCALYFLRYLLPSYTYVVYYIID